MIVNTLEDKAKDIYCLILGSVGGSDVKRIGNMVDLHSCIADDGCLECSGVLDYIIWCNNKYQKR